MHRGEIYYCDLGYGPKPWLVVSNNSRNRNLGSALVVRITTTSKPERATIVPLGPQDPVVGSILCDDLETLFDSDPVRLTGALTQGTLRGVDAALKTALGIP